MPARVIQGIEELKTLVGQVVATSDWLQVTQQRIDQFAEASGDRQWIHIDTARAGAESPYRGTIAHGFLTLSLLSNLMATSVQIEPRARLNINYGLNRLRFPAAVPSGARVRASFRLQSLEDIPDGAQLTWAVTVEVEGGQKPCLAAEWITRYYQ